MKKLAILLVIPMLLFTSGCESFIEDWDVSPNAPTEVTPALLLTVSEVALFTQYTSGLARNSSVYVQQMMGTGFQMVDVADYVLLEGDNINEWNSIYADILNESQTLIEKSAESPYYRGMGRVIKAMGLALATDMWGDVPNREALKGLGGEDFFYPRYDKQEIVYQDINALLDAAITDFNAPASANAVLPMGDDILFGGDVDLWKKAAYSLKARYAMRLSTRDAGAADKVLAAVAMGISDNAEDMNAIFGGNTNEWNTWYAFEVNRAGYVQMHETFIELMKSISDPRLPFYASTDDNGGYSGTPGGSDDQTTSKIGPYIASVSSPLPLVTYEESLFLEAEAQWYKGDKGAAATAHNAAIIASVEKVTGAAAPAAYVAAQASETATSITLAKIMTHKYVACFTMIEVYNDWRRTNIPTLVPHPGAAVATIPVRFPTPLDERVSNPNATVVSDITLPVWWDNN